MQGVSCLPRSNSCYWYLVYDLSCSFFHRTRINHTFKEKHTTSLFRNLFFYLKHHEHSSTHLKTKDASSIFWIKAQSNITVNSVLLPVLISLLSLFCIDPYMPVCILRHVGGANAIHLRVCSTLLAEMTVLEDSIISPGGPFHYCLCNLNFKSHN